MQLKSACGFSLLTALLYSSGLESIAHKELGFLLSFHFRFLTLAWKRKEWIEIFISLWLCPERKKEGICILSYCSHIV